MIHLKQYLDAVQAAGAEVLRIASEIDALFAEGKADEAMGRREELENAQAKSEEAERFYQSMRKAQTTVEGHAARFVPVDAQAEKQVETGQKTMTRSEYEAMDHYKRHSFFKAGGQLVEDPA